MSTGPSPGGVVEDDSVSETLSTKKVKPAFLPSWNDTCPADVPRLEVKGKLKRLLAVVSAIGWVSVLVYGASASCTVVTTETAVEAEASKERA
ncbi:MAG: hypothetical protein K0R62_3683 [Nonomuraea muscovyensis]|nr:hypothetical protein [Nonomuraea muscovyensis]